jgi:hypothetical protein
LGITHPLTHHNPEDQNTEYMGLLQNKRKLKLIRVIFQLQQIKQKITYPALFTDLALGKYNYIQESEVFSVLGINKSHTCLLKVKPTTVLQ